MNRLNCIVTAVVQERIAHANVDFAHRKETREAVTTALTACSNAPDDIDQMLRDTGKKITANWGVWPCSKLLAESAAEKEISVLAGVVHAYRVIAGTDSGKPLKLPSQKSLAILLAASTKIQHPEIKP